VTIAFSAGILSKYPAMKQNARLMPVAGEAHNRRFLTRAKLAAILK
jgi:hypothetical protein